MLKKTIMLAMAVAVAAAVAVPAVGMAGVWKHHNTAIAANKVISLTGTIKYAGGFIGSIECQTTATITLLAAGSSTGSLTQLEPDLDEAGSTVTTKCIGGGLLSSCSIHTVQPKGLNWTVHNKTQFVEITSGDIHITMTGASCPGTEVTVTPDVIIATPNVSTNPPQGHTVHDFTLSGLAVVHVYKEGKLVVAQNATVSGKQEILDNTKSGGDSAPNTYSLT